MTNSKKLGTKGTGPVQFEALRVRPASDSPYVLVVEISFSALADDQLRVERAVKARALRVAAFLLETALGVEDALGAIDCGWRSGKSLTATIRVEADTVELTARVLREWTGAMQAICEARS